MFRPGIPELLILLFVLPPLVIGGFSLGSGFVMWLHYLLVGSRKRPEYHMSPTASCPPTGAMVHATTPAALELPVLRPGQRLAMELIRDPMQRVYLPFVLLPAILLPLTIMGIALYDFVQAIIILVALAVIALALWINWRLLYAFVLGHSIKVSETQYPQLYRLIEEASTILHIETPATFIMQGHGLFETLVMKRFSRRGMVILTSNLVDDLTEQGASRELMFFIGRQLGLMATGYFRFWLAKGILGRIALPFYLAWERRCHFTADRIGLLVAGELRAAEQALVTITAGLAVAPSTSIDALKVQRHELFSGFWSWVSLSHSSYPFMIDRILRLRSFADQAIKAGVRAQQPVGALPIGHGRIRSVPILIIHGHDATSRLQLENFLFQKLPHVAPVSMILETDAAATLPEKFEELASRVSGAVALLTPDDMATTLRTGIADARARQNVVIEIGWFWGKFGRNRCLLLMKGAVEIPSDLSGVEIHRYRESPIEQSETVRDFIERLEAR